MSEGMKARLDFEHRLLNTKLACGKSLLELTEFEGTTLWWFIDSGFNEVVKTYFWGRKKVVNKRTVATSLKKYAASLNWATCLIHGPVLRLVSRILILPASARKYSASGSVKRILITGEDIEWRKMVDPETGIEIVTDQFFKKIIDVARADADYRFLSTFPLKPPMLHSFSAFFRSIDVVIDKKRTWDVQHIPFEAFSSILADCKRVKAWLHFSKIWEMLEKDPSFLELAQSEEVGSISGLLALFRRYFNYDLPEVAWRIEIARKCLEETSPDLVILEEEYGRFERGLIIGARESSIPTLGVQHGVIHEDHKGYMFRKGEIALDLSTRSPFAQVPDVTAVYGERHRRLLTVDSAFPSFAVEVTGQPRYDRIIEIQGKLNREEIRTSLSVPKSAKMVLMAMAFNELPEEENRFYLRCILQTINEMHETYLVIKQHPGENENHTKLILRMIADYQTPSTLAPKNADTLRLIWASDLVLTRYSTTGLEAIAFRKPLVVMNLSGQSDPVDYVSKGVAKGVYQATELRPTIEGLLQAEDNGMIVSRESYIEDNLHKIDGKASLRLYELMGNLFERNKNDSSRRSIPLAVEHEQK